MEDNRCMCIFPDTPVIDHYKVLREQVEKRVRENGWNTIMITSIGEKEGKTVTSINLALTFAKAFDDTVLLVDCSFEKQTIYKYFGFPGETGLLDVILDDKPMQEVIVWPGIDKLTIISGGRETQEGAEVLGSPKMQSLVKEMRNRYSDRYILFDMPPILGRAEAIAFEPMVDCILIVIQEGKTSLKDIQKALAVIPQEKILGLVMNQKRQG